MSTELDPQARALIGLALQGEQRLPRHRERVRRGVLTALAAPAALGTTEAALAAGKTAVVGTAAATSTKAALLAVPLLKAVPLVVLGVTAGVVGLKQLHAPPAKPVAAVVAAPVAAATTTPTAVSRAAAELVRPEATEPSEPPAPLKGTRGAPASNVESPSAAPAPPSLAAELEALQRAQRALNAGNAASALQELHAIKGPALRAERTALEVFAHCALGNAAAARQQAALFRKLAPGSPLLPRVEASCARPSAHD